MYSFPMSIDSRSIMIYGVNKKKIHLTVLTETIKAPLITQAGHCVLVLEYQLG